MHPLWQLKQVITFDGQRYVDRCMEFGQRASPRIWCLFMGLVVWIVIHKRGVDHLLHYMDDTWSYDLDEQLGFYLPYQAFFPKKQVVLLELWDKIGLPHEKPKQLYGRSLDIIGFHVDPQKLSIQMPEASQSDLVRAIQLFIDITSTRKHPLVEWQHLLGWINWALNAFPLLKPGLSSSYAKIRDKQRPRAPIYVNKQVCADLTWVANVVERGSGISYITSIAWGIGDAHLIIFCDTSLTGLAFYILSFSLAFYAPTPETNQARHIFFWEALAVVSAVVWATDLHYSPKRLLIFTDSMNTIDIFHSLKASEGYNALLLITMALLIDSHISLRVNHISGEKNLIADALSHALFHTAADLHHGLTVHLFSPPWDAMGESQI
jgi:hypothetical protein